MNLSELAQVLKDIEKASGSNAKKSILKSNESYELKLFLRIVYDPYIRFNVARVIEVPDYKILNCSDINSLIDALDLIFNKTLTGHEALKHVWSIHQALPEDFRPYLEKILKKDLKIGIASGIINDVFSELIPEFKLALCERFKKIKPSDIQFPLMSEPKIDGVRASAFVYPDHVEILARSGLQYDNYKTIEKELSSIHQFKGFVIDGEIKDLIFNKTMGTARRKYNVDDSSSIFRIWDIIPIEEFLNEKCSEILEVRRTRLEGSISETLHPHLRILPYDWVFKFEDIEPAFEKWFSQGEEGTILKNPKSYYSYSSGTKRGKDWFKFKIQDRTGADKRLDVTAKIIGFYSGDRGTKNEYRLGGFNYEVLSSEELVPEGKIIRGNCGGGFSDAQRDEYWDNREELIDKIFDISAQEVSVNKKGQYSLRFPVFKGWRNDR